MNKKGFTLIEILAVVIILAVLAVITIPITLRLIEDARMNALKTTARSLIDSAKYYYNNKVNRRQMNNTIEFVIKDGKAKTDEKLDYHGTVDNAYVKLFSDGEVAICVDDNKYAAKKSAISEEIIVTKETCTGEWDEETKSYISEEQCIIHNYGEFTLNIKAYTSINKLPEKAENNDIAVITEDEITGYYAGYKEPTEPVEGMVWVVSKIITGTDFKNEHGIIPINYVVQYKQGEWVIKDSYIYDGEAKEWVRLEFYDKSEYVYDYEYTGNYQTFTAPHTGTYEIELWGAEGGTNSAAYVPGKGAYTKGLIYLEAGETLYVYVGGTGTKNTGGWNGGGNGLNSGFGGGGATDVRLTKTSATTTWNEFKSLKSRIMIAAGGGGGGYYNANNNAYGGAGGALSGGSAIEFCVTVTRAINATGGTQTKGGSSNGSGSNGSFATGGKGSGNGYQSGGGGGGYYGGAGGGVAYGSAGAGGSSYISGYDGCNSIDENNSETVSSIIHTGNSVHSSGKKFDNGVMTPGVNEGNGKARIVFKAFGEYNPPKQKMNEGDMVVYNYVGGYQAFHVTTTGTYLIELWGAGGGTNSASYIPGKGAYTKGEIYLTAGETLYVYIGGKGTEKSGGGYNGGGFGSNNSSAGSGGGGATDIRVNVTSGDWDNFDSLKNRIMVAGGGGGGSYYNATYNSLGGDSGILGIRATQTTALAAGNVDFLGRGGTQTAAGTGSSGCQGSFGTGGKGAGNGYNAGGGGGGWYGGAGGGAIYGAAGGGGSSYISGHKGCNAVRETSTSDNILHLDNDESPTGYKFVNTQIISGVNEGNGYAHITFLKKKQTTEVNEVKDIYTFEYSGGYVPFKIPKSGYYQVELWGAQGRNATNDNGGLGAYTSGRIYLDEGTLLYVFVGGQPNGKSGDLNGGGTTVMGGYGGGGATDVRTIAGSSNNTKSLASRIMVAAGGGGGGYYNGSYRGAGGAGGGLIGYENGRQTTNCKTATGGTQIAGGTSTAGNGSFGQGGNGNGNGYAGAGGGAGGWYGGAGGGTSYGTAGAGGSSYISGHAGCIGVNAQGEAKASSYSSLSDSYSNTGYRFTNTVMIDGQGYKWTTTKGSSIVNMPDYDGIATKTGNAGNGYAKFTYLGE